MDLISQDKILISPEKRSDVLPLDSWDTDLALVEVQSCELG